MEEERARRLAAARAYAEELDTLGERPSSTWPASVRTLVRQRESAAAEVRPQCRLCPCALYSPWRPHTEYWLHGSLSMRRLDSG